MSVHRVYNFSAGPATLPLPVLEEAQRDLLALPGTGMSVMEMSHRSKPFEAILAKADASLRALLGISDDYAVLFLQGGASQQFAAVPMNLLGAGQTADYVLTGSWAEKALQEAKKFGATHVAATTKDVKYARVPQTAELSLTAGAAYVHMTSNNTIYGTQFHDFPATGDAPLVCDASSDICCRPLDVSKFGVIYAGAQKNLGPSGVTVVIVRKDLLTRPADSLPTVLNYRVMAENNSLYNTPPTFGIYILSLVLQWLQDQGGLPAVEAVNRRKAQVLYDEIDRSEFWRPHAETNSRSLMNVTFRLPSEDLEKQFVKDATAAGFDGLKGHRSVGGLRASIYNAFPEAGIRALVEFMQEFERTKG